MPKLGRKLLLQCTNYTMDVVFIAGLIDLACWLGPSAHRWPLFAASLPLKLQEAMPCCRQDTAWRPGVGMASSHLSVTS